jgi:hypothetical protein
MARLTYTNILDTHFRNIGKAGQQTDTDLLADFNANLGTRYQLILANIASYINESARTATTVASTQYYSYPPGIISLDSISITIGSFKYTLSPIYDQTLWNQLNTMTIQPTAIPQFYFPRKDDFGIWPIPSDAWTINYTTFDRDRNLSVADYTTGTALCTTADATVVGTGTTWTDAMVGRWFSITDTTVRGQGYWYRVASVTDTTHLELDRNWNNATILTSTYRIGESPELPEEAHVLLASGTASDYYAGVRNDIEKATYWNNIFWTGDGNNNIRDKDNKNVSSGLIGLIKNYENRDKSNMIYKTSTPLSPYFKVFATTLS